MDEPQPNTAPIEGAEASAQPIDAVQVEAEQPQEPAQEAQAPSEEAPSSDDTAEWLSKKGIDPSDPDSVLKLAKSYREAEKLALAKAQEASELKKSLMPEPSTNPQTFDDPNLAALSDFAQEYKREKQINAFREAHPDWKEHEPAMVEVLNTTLDTPYGQFTRSQLVNMGVMTLNDVYAMAKGSAPVNTEKIKTEAQQEVLQTLANTQRAGGANAHAMSATPAASRLTKENVDSWWEGLGTAGRKDPANKAMLDRILAS